MKLRKMVLGAKGYSRVAGGLLHNPVNEAGRGGRAGPLL